MIAAINHIVGTADSQTLNYFAELFGALPGEASRNALWDFVERGVARGQSLTAISWRKDPRDLPRLAELLVAPATGDPRTSGAPALPYALRNAYGEAALPYLESALKASSDASVQAACARELVLAGRSTGFAFIGQAIEQNRPDKRELIEFLRGRFPELRGADEAAILAFAKQRSN